MMPAFVKAVLRKLSAGLALFVLIALLLAWPARHVLEPLWPGPVEELLYLAAEGEAGRDLVPVRRAAPSRTGPVLARSRPLSLVRVEMTDGGWRHGYLLGVSSADDLSLHDDVPEPLQQAVAEVREGDYDMLVLAGADGKRVGIPVLEVQRLVYPNRLAVLERVQLAWQRFADRLAERPPDGMATDDHPVETASLQ